MKANYYNEIKWYLLNLLALAIKNCQSDFQTVYSSDLGVQNTFSQMHKELIR